MQRVSTTPTHEFETLIELGIVCRGGWRDGSEQHSQRAGSAQPDFIVNLSLAPPTRQILIFPLFYIRTARVNGICECTVTLKNLFKIN